MSDFDFGKGGAGWNANFAKGDDGALTWEVFDEADTPFSWVGASVSAVLVGAAFNWSVDITTTGLLTVSLTDTQTNALGIGVFKQYLRVVKGSETATWLAGLLTIRDPTEPTPQGPSSLVVRVATLTMGTIRLQGCIGGSGGGGGGGGLTVIELTLAMYGALGSEAPNTLYVIDPAGTGASETQVLVDISLAAYNALGSEAPDTLYVIG